MSRVGKQPIIIPAGVTVKTETGRIVVSGPKGELQLSTPPRVSVKIDNQQIICQADRKDSHLWGLTRSLINNSVLGVLNGWSKTLELSGVGFRAALEADQLVLSIGFSHPVKIKAPAGISFGVVENKITVSGVDKQLVGEITAQIRRIRPPEPYKGKGIKYQGEKIRRKLGKAAKTIGTAAGAGGK